jgi:hypothetical protein
MEETASVEGSPPTPKRPRGRPRKESIERENLAKVLKSNLTADVSRRFLQKMALLKVNSPQQQCLTIRRSEG